jgi:3-hydroxyacyl-[acyl-carrier-protein] dehydratase
VGAFDYNQYTALVHFTCRFMVKDGKPRRGVALPESHGGHVPAGRKRMDGVTVADPVATSNAEKQVIYSVTDIMKILPHRYPFLLVDRITELEPNKRIVGIKNVTINEQFFQGHFPGAPVMPGVLVIESMAQVAAVLFYRDETPGEKLIYFAGIESAKFRRPVIPGDQLRIEMEVRSRRSNCGKMSGQATVDGKLVAEAIVTCVITDHPGK